MNLALVFLEFPGWLPFLAGIIVLVATIVVAGVVLERRRRDALAALALEIGFQYLGKDWGNEAPQLGVRLFGKGHDPEFRNIMAGSASGFVAYLFDYQYVTGSGRGSQTHAQTVASFRNPGVSMPEFELQPEGILQKIGDAFVHKDIDFDSHPEFSRRIQLRSPDEAKTRELFSPGLLSYLEGLEPAKKWRIEGIGDTLLLYRGGKRVKPMEFKSFLAETSSIASQFFALAGMKKTPT